MTRREVLLLALVTGSLKELHLLGGRFFFGRLNAARAAGAGAFEQLGEGAKVVDDDAPEALLVEGGGGVVHGDEDAPVGLARPPVDAGDSLIGEEARHRVAPERHDEEWIDEADLGAQVVAAGLDLGGQGSRFPGGRHLRTLQM